MSKIDEMLELSERIKNLKELKTIMNGYDIETTKLLDEEIEKDMANLRKKATQKPFVDWGSVSSYMNKK